MRNLEYGGKAKAKQWTITQDKLRREKGKKRIAEPRKMGRSPRTNP